MTIVEAEKRCDELNKQIVSITKEYDFGGFAKYCGRVKTRPLKDELCKLCSAINKAKEITEIILY